MEHLVLWLKVDVSKSSLPIVVTNWQSSIWPSSSGRSHPFVHDLLSSFVNQASKLVDTEVMEPVGDVEEKEYKRKHNCSLLIPIYVLKSLKRLSVMRFVNIMQTKAKVCTIFIMCHNLLVIAQVSYLTIVVWNFWLKCYVLLIGSFIFIFPWLCFFRPGKQKRAFAKAIGKQCFSE